jgi:hypothetical protein
MNRIQIDIGKDFSDVPSGRFPEDGDFNGERFRKEFLVPALNSADVVVVLLDNTEGYGSSFLEEAFGGLVRVEGFDRGDLKKRLLLDSHQSRTARYKRKIEQYIEKAQVS